MNVENITRKSVGIGLASCLALWLSSASVAAQNANVVSAGKLYAGAAFELSYQANGPRDAGAPDQPTSRVGGSAWAGAATFGYRLTPLVSLAAEVSVPSRFKSLQEIDYFDVSQSERHHRDTIVSALVHLHPRNTGPIRPEFVVGISYVQEDTLSRTARAPIFGPGAGLMGAYSNDPPLQRDTLGVTAGADFGASLGEHVDLVPQFRAHWIDRAEFGAGRSGFLYLNPLVIRGGIGLRITF